MGYWIERALEGEEIAIVHKGRVVALRPVEISSGDYALQEYGLTSSEVAAASARIQREVEAARKRGELKPFTGKAGDLR